MQQVDSAWTVEDSAVCTGAEMLVAGLATHLVPSDRLPELEKAICQLGKRASQPAAVADAISQHQVQAMGSPSTFAMRGQPIQYGSLCPCLEKTCLRQAAPLNSPQP